MPPKNQYGTSRRLSRLRYMSRTRIRSSDPANSEPATKNMIGIVATTHEMKAMPKACHTTTRTRATVRITSRLSSRFPRAVAVCAAGDGNSSAYSSGGSHATALAPGRDAARCSRVDISAPR